MAAEAERDEVEQREEVEAERVERTEVEAEVVGAGGGVELETKEEEVRLEGEGAELEKPEVELEREEIKEEVEETIKTEAEADMADQTLETSDAADVKDTLEAGDAAEEGKGNEAEGHEANVTDRVEKSNGTEEAVEEDVDEGKEAIVTDKVEEAVETEAVEEGKEAAAEGLVANVTVTEMSDEMVVESVEAVEEEKKVSEEEGDEADGKELVQESVETEVAGEEGLEAEVEGHEANVTMEVVQESAETEVAREEGHEAEVEGHGANVTMEAEEALEVGQEAEADGDERDLNVKEVVDYPIETRVSGEEELEAEVEGHELNATVSTAAVEEADVGDNVMEETTEAEETEAAGEGAEEMEADEMEGADGAEEMEADENEAAGEEEAEETNTASLGGKRKRRKNSKAAAVSEKVLSKKKEEDVCFICFDGGELVLCDRRGCPKAYHPSCVNRDEVFFRSKGRWNCGWHLCSNCEKNAQYMCYTCTFSLCKACTKDAVIFCVKGNKGFCETCMKTVMLIEKNEHGNKDKEAVDFDDKSSWEYLFKDYWIDLKERLSLTLNDLAQAKNPWKGSAGHANKLGSNDEPYDANNDGGSDSYNSENLDSTNSKRRNKKRLKTRAKGKNSSSPATGSGGRSADDKTDWASKELLEFVMHMRNGDSSALSQFDVQALLLEYIKRNKLRDPRRKSQIICDLRLQSLFGKPRVGHFEMLKLLESHFFMKEDSQIDDLQGSVVDTEGNEADGNSDTLTKASKDKKRKRKKGAPQSNVEDFAAIDIHNISLIYLRRNLVEDLLEDMDNFQEKVAGSFVRIRISGSGQKQDLYRLVQVIGTCKAAEPYKVGKRMTDTLLEILNLNKTEIVTIDIISNQDFTEDECKRLRQSIKCGLINRLTVGDIQEKAVVLQPVRVKDWLETETVRLQHLRDRASEKGRRKELRECVEKLQLLKTPEERQRRLEETLEIHADPNMDPSYESEEDEDEGGDQRQDSYTRPTGSGFGRKGREPISPRRGGSSLNDSWSGSRNFSNMNRDFGRSMSSKGIFNKVENSTGAGDIVNDTWGQGRETPQTNHWENKQNISSLETGSRSTQSVVPSEAPPAGAPENKGAPLSLGVAQSGANINETEKNWHYQDPSGKVQGPFSMIQLRKWNNTGYFPPNLRVWKNTDTQEDSILVTDALVGKFQKDPSIPKAQMVHDSHLMPAISGKAQGAQLQQTSESQGGSWGAHEINSSAGRGTPSSVEVPKYSSDGWGTTNFPSPTPSQTPITGAKRQAYENNWSASPGGNGVVQSHAVLTPECAMRVSGNDHSTSLPGMTAAPNSLQMHGQVNVSGLVLANASMKPLPDVQNIVSNLQNLVQSVTSRTTASDTRAWGSGTVPGSESQPWGGAPSQKIEPNNATNVPAQLLAHGYWPPTNNGTSSVNTGSSTGNFPAQGLSGVPNSDAWRPPVPSNQSYIQPPAQPQAPWGSSVPDNQSAVPRMGQESQNSGWGPVAGNSNVAWGGPVPGNTNMNWVPPSQGPGWSASGQGPVRGNAVPSWAPPPGQGPPSVSANPGWAPPGQGPALGNPNSGWSAPIANQTQNGDRFSKQRDHTSHGGDSGFGGGKPWNRQPSFGGGGGGGSSRPPFKGRVCRYYESGHCKKGASCDYLHPDQ